MKKELKKKIKLYSNAVRYFSSELSVPGQTNVDLSCYQVESVYSCPCA